jgi:hypothetical protein
MFLLLECYLFVLKFRITKVWQMKETEYECVSEKRLSVELLAHCNACFYGLRAKKQGSSKMGEYFITSDLAGLDLIHIIHRSNISYILYIIFNYILLNTTLVVRHASRSTCATILAWEKFCHDNNFKSIDLFQEKISTINHDEIIKFFYVIDTQLKLGQTTEKMFDEQMRLQFSKAETSMQCFKEFRRIEHARAFELETIQLLGRLLLKNVPRNMCIIGVDSIVTVIRLLLFLNDNTEVNNSLVIIFYNNFLMIRTESQ